MKLTPEDRETLKLFLKHIAEEDNAHIGSGFKMRAGMMLEKWWPEDSALKPDLDWALVFSKKILNQYQNEKPSGLIITNLLKLAAAYKSAIEERDKAYRDVRGLEAELKVNVAKLRKARGHANYIMMMRNGHTKMANDDMSALIAELVGDEIEMATSTSTPASYQPERELCDLANKAHDVLEPEDLDGLVHDAKSEEATSINNSGVEGQIDYLCESFGTRDMITFLKQIIKEKGKS